MTSVQRIQYKKGKAAAAADKPSTTCPIGLSFMELRHHWLAGWHDWHIEHETGVLS